MGSKVHFIGNDTYTRKYKLGDYGFVLDKIRQASIIALDTETNVTESILNRELKVISVAWEIEGEVEMAVFAWEDLSARQAEGLLHVLNQKKCVMHNVSFDYQILAKYGCIIERTYCTYLQEQVLTNGLSKETGYYALQGLYSRRVGIDISKASQLTFGDGGPYTDQQVQYAALDVFKLLLIHRQQHAEMRSDDKFMHLSYHKGLRKTAWWENEFVKVVGDMETTGVRIDKPRWYGIEDSIIDSYYEKKELLNDIVTDELREDLVEAGYMSEEDRLENLWDSPAKRKAILSLDFDGIESTSGPNLKRWLQANDPKFPVEITSATGVQWGQNEYRRVLDDKYAVMKLLIGRKPATQAKIDVALNQYVLSNHRMWLVSQGWLIPAGKLVLNWDSSTQKKEVFQMINPSIEKTGKDYLVDYEDSHMIFPHYLKYAEISHQLKAFGKRYYDENVDIDGRFRTRFRQVLKTGRLSSTKPNLLAIPGKDIYRRCFVPEDGKVLVGADYSSEELVIMAVLSQEKTWLEAMAKGWDMHSVNAELTYGQKWLEATESGCVFYAKDTWKSQCECAEHQRMRKAVKTVIFSSAYGGSHIKIAFLLKISEKEAKQLLHDFHTRVPALKAMMDRFGKYAVEKGRIIEPVFGRSRFYDKWKLKVEKERGKVKRASLNYPIQSSGGAILKIAAVLLRRWINQSNLRRDVKLILTVHDEFLLEVDPRYQDIAKEKLQHYMQLGAKLAGFDIKADAEIGTNWSECH